MKRLTSILVATALAGDSEALRGDRDAAERLDSSMKQGARRPRRGTTR